MPVIRENAITFLSHLALTKQRQDSVEFSKKKFSPDFNIDELRKKIYELEELKNGVVGDKQKVEELGERISVMKNKLDKFTSPLP